MMTLPTKRRRLQFSLRALLLLVTLCAVLLGGLAYRRDRQRRAVEAIRRLGGIVTIRYQSKLDIVGTAEWVTLSGRLLNDKRVSDEDLVPLRSLRGTTELDLAYNRITDEGLAHLEELTNLEQLDLENNLGITDEGLEHLDGLIRLKVVDFLGTNVTKAGVAKLQKALPNTQIVLD